MTTLSEPQALPDLIAGYRLVTRLRDEGVFGDATHALRLEAMRAKAWRLGIAREFREGCEAGQPTTTGHSSTSQDSAARATP